MLGNANLLDVSAAIKAAAGDFYARQIAAKTGLPDPVVHPCLRRLEAAGVIVEMESAERQRTFRRVSHPYWQLVGKLDAEHPG